MLRLNCIQVREPDICLVLCRPLTSRLLRLARSSTGPARAWQSSTHATVNDASREALVSDVSVPPRLAFAVSHVTLGKNSSISYHPGSQPLTSISKLMATAFHA